MQHCSLTPDFQFSILVHFCMRVELAQSLLPVKQSFKSTPTMINSGVYLKSFAACQVVCFDTYPLF